MKTSRSPLRIVFSVLAVAILAGGLAACSQKELLPTRLPTPTPPIRHREALPLIMVLEDLGSGYTTAEMRRLEKGKGWGDDTTRLSGYRHVYRGNQTPFAEIICQVECYLSAQDAQAAYRVYKEQIVTGLRKSELYAAINESEASGLGEWGTAFNMRGRDNKDFEAMHYLFLRENVLVEVALAGNHSLTFADEALKLAQIVDQRILARP